MVTQIRRVELEQEREKSRILQESLHVLAQEHLQLERSITTNSGFRPPSVLSMSSHPRLTSSQSIVAGSEIDEFYDCASDGNISTTC